MIAVVVDAGGERHRLTVDAAHIRSAAEETAEPLPSAMAPLLVAALIELGPRPASARPGGVLLAKAGTPTADWVRAGERRWRIAVGEPGEPGEPGGSPAAVLDVVDAGDGGLWSLHASPVAPDAETGDLVPGAGAVLRPITSTDVWTWISRHIATCT